MTLLKKFFCLLVTIIACSEIALAQSVDESEDLYFFDIEDENSEDTFFDISAGDESDVEPDPQYSFTGSIRQDLTYGIASPSEIFLRNKTGFEKINTEFFLQVQGRPTPNSKIKISGVVDYDWGGWINDGFTLGGREANFQEKDLFLDVTTENGVWVRVGNQIVARGELESVKITDIVNPIDISYPGQVEFKDIRIQVPALLVSIPIANATAEVILMTDAGSDRLGTAGAGSAFDYSILENEILATLPNGLTVEREETDLIKTWEAVGRINFKLNGGDISFTAGEINWNQSNLQTVKESAPYIMEYGYDRVNVVGLSGNIVRGNYLLKYETAWNNGRKFQKLNPLAGSSDHQEIVTGLGLEYSGITDTVLSFELNNSNIRDYSPDLLVDENESGFVIQARWSGLNDLLSVYGAFNNLSGDDSTISTLFAEYDLTDAIKLDGRIIIYDAKSRSDSFYNFKEQDVFKASVKYSF